MSDFCYQYAEEFTLDTTKWYDFEIILQNVPIIAPDPALYLKYRKYAQVQDSLRAYYLKIHDFRLKGGNKPLRLVEDNIKHLIINKRQQSFLEKLRNNVYNSAINNEFETFKQYLLIIAFMLSCFIRAQDNSGYIDNVIAVVGGKNLF